MKLTNGSFIGSVAWATLGAGLASFSNLLEQVADLQTAQQNVLKKRWIEESHQEPEKMEKERKQLLKDALAETSKKRNSNKNE